MAIAGLSNSVAMVTSISAGIFATLICLQEELLPTCVKISNKFNRISFPTPVIHSLIHPESTISFSVRSQNSSVESWS